MDKTFDDGAASPLNLNQNNPAISTSPLDAEPLSKSSNPLPLLSATAWKRGRWGLLWLGAGLALIPFSQFTGPALCHFLEHLNLDGLFNTARQFPTVWGYLTVITLILMVDFAKARYLPYLIVAVAIGGLSNEVIKQASGRMRPEYSMLFKDARRWDDLAKFQEKYPRVSIKIQKIDQWFMLNGQLPMFVDIFGSFPSGHANSAFVLAAFLQVLYRRTRWLVFVYAVVCALSRIEGRRHYLEDVCVGGAMGWMIAFWVFTWTWPARLGLRLENALLRWSCFRPAPAD